MRCEIRAPSDAAPALAETVRFCAEQSGYALVAITRPVDTPEMSVTLHVPPDRAACDQPVLCFVCRLACLCPQARVGVFVPARKAAPDELLRQAS